MEPDAETMCLEIPAQPALVGIARNVVVAVAQSSAAADPERLEDLRLAVSEACTTAVEGQRPAGDGDREGGRVTLRCLEGPGRLALTVEYAGGLDDVVDAPERAWSLPLMEALVDDVEITDDAGTGRTTIRLVLTDLSR